MQNIWNNETLIKVLQNGGVVVMPTDTIYGVVGSALNPDTVQRIYEIKKRNPEKKLINLIADWGDTEKFGIDISKYIIPEFQEPTTLILEEISFRVPQNPDLRELLAQTGPLVAPSANPEGLPPAENISQAKEYFNDSVDLFIDGGTLIGKPSKLIKLHKDGMVDIIRN
jgi:L-threonylcarbamoyladenylate synthase